MGSAPNLAYSGKPSGKLSCDRLITETNALGKTRTFTYDAAGNRTGLTDRNGKTRCFSFDARDHPFRVLGSDRLRI